MKRFRVFPKIGREIWRSPRLWWRGSWDPRRPKGTVGDGAAPAKAVQRALLACFDEPNQTRQDGRKAARPLPAPTPVPLRPSVGMPSTLAEPAPLTMTALQQLVAADGKLPDRDRLERTWQERRRMRRSEKIMLNAAVYVSAALITGAFAFVHLEDSVASSRQEADRRWLAARQEMRALIAAEAEEARMTASLALTQARWTDLLSFIKDGRRLLPEIRDHYAQWSYAPFHEPDLQVIKQVEATGRGLGSVHLRVDAAMPWASTIVMDKVDGVFKLDWHSFQGRFEREPVARRGENALLGAAAFEMRIGEDSFLESTFRSGHGIASLGSLPYLGDAGIYR